MKLNKKTSISLFVVVTISLIVADYYDRKNSTNRLVNGKVQSEFLNYKTSEEVEKAFEKNFKNPKYSFSKTEIKKIKVYKNQFLISRLNSVKVTEKQKNEIIDFFNNPENFDYGETTWELNEAEYILRFYDKNEKEVHKIWICLKDCGMTFSKNFSPNMKFGGISESGKLKIIKILNNY